MHFPFLFLCLSLIAGIWGASAFNLSTPASHIGLAVGLALAWIFYLYKKNRVCFFFILLSTVCIGAGLFSHHNRKYEENPLHRWQQPGYVDFTGTLDRSPSPGLERDFLFITVEKIAFQNREQNIRGRLRVSIPHSAEYAMPRNLFPGDKIKVSAQLQSFQKYRNFQKPFMINYLKNRRIHNLAATKSGLLIHKLKEGKKYSPFRLMAQLRSGLRQKIEQHFPSPDQNSLSPEGAVLEALVLGERGRMNPATTLSLQKTGLYHLFAISGAHIGIICFLLFSLLKWGKVPTRFSYAVLIIFLVFYAFLVEGRASVLRATIMAVLFFLGKLFWKDVHLLNTIAMSAFFLLLTNPFQLFDLGFQLTFIATLSIILFFPKVNRLLPRLPLRLSEIFALSLTAQAGVLPLIAVSFNRIVFSSLILNFMAIPLVGLIMAAGYVFLPLSFVIPALARPLAGGIDFLIQIFMKSTQILNPIDFLSYRIPTPPPWIVLGYFAFLLLLLLPLRIKKMKWLLGFGFGIFFILLILHPFPSVSKDLKITFLDVGQGDSILIEFPGTHKMLIDGGGLPTGTFDIGENVVSRFLWRKGIKKIDYLVLTHSHPDHLNGLVAVARNFRVREFWEGPSPSDNTTYGALKKQLDSVLQKRVSRGFSRRVGEIQIDVLSPEKEAPFAFVLENDLSVVLRITHGLTFFLLTGDIGRDAEKEILDTGGRVRSQVLKSSHHGSDSSSSMIFLESVAPQVVVVSVGKKNPYNLPSQEALERYREVEARIFRTDFHGAVEIISDGREISVRTASGELLPGLRSAD
ncbi:MAG: DNA internalization-related competence protein ComEC/Rec2 [Candidatus Aminicenantales bacterium]